MVKIKKIIYLIDNYKHYMKIFNIGDWGVCKSFGKAPIVLAFSILIIFPLLSINSNPVNPT